MDPVRLNWTGGEHDFALPIGQLRALQESCDAGPEEVFNRLRTGRWKVNDILEPIRLGLIGSGAKTSAEAGPLVTSLFEQNPKADLKLTALAVLAHALLGPGDDPVGEPEGVTTPAPESGASPASTETGQ